VEYEYRGLTWSLPDELIGLQVQIARADAACAAAVAANDNAALRVARDERLRLVVEKFRRAADWRASFQGQSQHARWLADWALQAYARSVLEGGVSSSTSPGGGLASG
jgi:hypothetical protein